MKSEYERSCANAQNEIPSGMNLHKNTWLTVQQDFPFARAGRPPAIVPNSVANKLFHNDKVFHDWYRFVLSFPPHLVREYMQRFGLREGSVMLDPFCGTGTAIVEAKRCGISSIGIEANPMAHFASSVKISWDIDPERLMAYARSMAQIANQKMVSCRNAPLRTLPDETLSLLLNHSISPLPLHKSLILADTLQSQGRPQFQRHEMLALAKSLVISGSNLHFGPEVGVRRIKKLTRQ